VPGAIKAGLENRVLEIRSDGKMVREYLFVGDVAEAYLLLAEQIGKAKGQAFNFGSGERLKVLEVVDKVAKIMRRPIKTKVLNVAKNEIPEQYLSSEKARKTLGWKAAYGFEKGVAATLPWYQRMLG